MLKTPELAQEIHAALTARRQITPFSRRFEGFDLTTGYAIAADLRALQAGRVLGRKIGFTNRTIWDRYGVNGPMWGDMTDKTVHPITDAPIALSPFLEPRLEPEVALKLRSTPAADMDDATLLSTVDWFAPAFEIVHSLFPHWQFTLADCAAVGGLHGALYLGPPTANGAWADALPSLTLELFENGSVKELGAGSNVLGGPMQALRHLIETLLADGAPPLQAGDIVTTGTLTDAQPLAPGAHFEARYHGSPLSTIAARFTAD